MLKTDLMNDLLHQTISSKHAFNKKTKNEGFTMINVL